MSNMDPESEQEVASANSKILIIILIVITLAGLGYLLTNSNSVAPTASPSPAAEVMIEESTLTPPPTPETMGETTSVSPEAVTEFTLEAGSFYYAPNTITVKAGTTVRVTINSVDMMHDFVIDEFDVASEVTASGESATVEFVADKTGEYEFYCSVGAHRQQGMVGTLVVEE